VVVIQGTNGLNQIISVRRLQMSKSPCDRAIPNTRYHCELPVAANSVNPSGFAKSHCFLQSWLIPERPTLGTMSRRRFTPYCGDRQASRDSGSQSTAIATSMGQPKQQMEPKNRELHNLIRNSQVALLLAKNVDPDEISLKTNEPANIR
jgi:hypothetical protein